MNHKKISFFDKLKLYEKLILTLVFSVLLYIIAAQNNNTFINLISTTDYLTWHVIFEFASILVSFSIFAVTFFVYEESGNLSMIILGCAFLAMGFLDAFHTFSYQGMPEFFITNKSANRATTLWILSRTLGSLGLLVSVSIPDHVRSNKPKTIFAFTTTAISIFLFIIVTYYPNILPAMHTDEGSLTSIKIFMEYFIIVIMSLTFLIVLKNYHRTRHRREHQFMIVLIFLIFSEFSFTNYGSVYDAFNYIGHIYKIIAFMILYKAIYVANVSEPYRQMKRARNELKEYSENLNSIVDQRTNELVELNSTLLKDIEYAREMQLRLIPEQMPKDFNISFHAEYLPAERLSGDFYNVIRLDEDNIAIYLGDVSGHGVAAAMLTVFANQHIVPLKQDEDKGNKITPPNQVLSTMYKAFNNTNFDDSTYLVMLYGIYNTKTKVFKYSSAGLNVSPYLVKSTGHVIELNSRGFAICKLGEYISPNYEIREILVDSGDKLLLYSDGLIEAKNSNNEIFGQEKMKRFLEENYELNAINLDKELQNNLYQHIGKKKSIDDDITLLIMEVT